MSRPVSEICRCCDKRTAYFGAIFCGAACSKKHEAGECQCFNLELPWRKPISHYDDDGPAKSILFGIRNKNDALTYMRVEPTNVLAPTTLRTRFRVVCVTCDVVVHEATTGSTPRCRDHLKSEHGIIGGKAEVSDL